MTLWSLSLHSTFYPLKYTNTFLVTWEAALSQRLDTGICKMEK